MTNPDRYKDAPKVTQTEVAEGLKETGLKPGDVVLVHSAMRTLGHVDGGAETVVAALLEMLGERGTLVVPTFTFVHQAEEDPIIDPANDPSEMGIITETVRQRPNALRSTTYRHSFAAIGRRAQVITEVDPALSPFDLRSSFGVMLALNTQVLLLGLTYAISTSHHFAEWVCDVPYRHTIDLQVKVRRKDGSIVQQAMLDYQPFTYTGSSRPDFNRLGRILEQHGLVGMAAIGNAAVRRFGMRDLVDLAVAADDPYIFRTPEGQTDYFTPLDFGKIVFGPETLDDCGRPTRSKWCVMDEKKLLMPA